jgi:aminoglycoside phosphotransferase (APT) family kinase protein
MVEANTRHVLGEGREAEIVEWEPGAVAKLYRNPAYAHVARVEWAALAAAKSAGAPVPAVQELIDVDGRPAIIMERLDGADLLTSFSARPWTIVRLGRLMGRAHAELHAVRAPDELRDLRAGLREALAHSDLIPPDLRDVSSRALDRLPDGDRLGHGDFHPGNVILTPHGPRVIDWPNAFRGDPDADVARTLLTLRLGEPLDVPPHVRAILAVARRVITWAYRRGYRSLRPYSEAAVDAWMLPVAIHRLTDGIAEERERLMAFIETCRAKSDIGRA